MLALSSGVLALVQDVLQQVYRLDLDVDVCDFYIGAEQYREIAARGGRGVDAPEQLLVMEEEGETALALFIADDVMMRLSQSDPLRRLTPENLADFCLLAEGVSHFVYYTWKRHRGERVTQLEMELQAEVDKYITCYLAHWQQDRGRFPERLKGALFRRVTFRHDLQPEESERYLTANRLALRYCEHLERSYLRGGNLRAAMPDLRRFYRLTHRGKIERIAVLNG